MEALSSVSLLLGSSWASGINLYLTVGLLGIAHRMEWITLPGSMDSISNPLIIMIALLLYAVEFIADKVPLVDSVWDSVHTFIRPVGGAVLGLLATSNFGPEIQVPVGILAGTISLDSHLTKATSRMAINTSPEPVTNSIASVTEDASVVGVIYLIIKHPIIAALCVIVFIIFSIWFLKVMFRFVKRIFGSRNKEPVKQSDA